MVEPEFPYTLRDVRGRIQHLKTLLELMEETGLSLSEAKKIDRLTKNPNLLRLGLSLMLLPEPLTTAVGLPLIAYSLSKRNTVELGEELASSYNELWRTLSNF
jgi:hypothetical protein